tara:strand:+ start:2805 stop:3638 length:834 start_codon:yes stop_codon:yes gene_type:complete
MVEGIVMNSGAKISMFEKFVLKTGEGPIGERVESQGRWLSDARIFNPLLFPYVHATIPNGYIMERLTPIHLARIDKTLLFVDVIQKLEELWTTGQGWHVHNKDTPDYDERCEGRWEEHMSYIMSRAASYCPWVVPHLVGMQDNLDPTKFHYCKAHGDPTLENVMLHPRDGRIVLIDPLPPSNRIPECKESDVGKLMQSASGYEDIKISRTAHVQFARKHLHTIFSTVGWVGLDYEHERMAAQYFELCCWVRLIPYQQEMVRHLYEERLRAIIDFRNI